MGFHGGLQDESRAGDQVKLLYCFNLTTPAAAPYSCQGVSKPSVVYVRAADVSSLAQMKACRLISIGHVSFLVN